MALRLVNMRELLVKRWRAILCRLFHGGGEIGFDCDGPFWECRKCGRVVR